MIAELPRENRGYLTAAQVQINRLKSALDARARLQNGRFAGVWKVRTWAKPIEIEGRELVFPEPSVIAEPAVPTQTEAAPRTTSKFNFIETAVASFDDLPDKLKRKLRYSPHNMLKEVVRNIRTDGIMVDSIGSSHVKDMFSGFVGMNFSGEIASNSQYLKVHKRSLQGSMAAAVRNHRAELLKYVVDGKVSDEISQSSISYLHRLAGMSLRGKILVDYENITTPRVSMVA